MSYTTQVCYGIIVAHDAAYNMFEVATHLGPGYGYRCFLIDAFASMVELYTRNQSIQEETYMEVHVNFPRRMRHQDVHVSRSNLLFESPPPELITKLQVYKLIFGLLPDNSLIAQMRMNMHRPSFSPSSPS